MFSYEFRCWLCLEKTAREQVFCHRNDSICTLTGHFLLTPRTFHIGVQPINNVVVVLGEHRVGTFLTVKQNCGLTYKLPSHEDECGEGVKRK